MYLPVFVFFMVVLGSVALDSRADGLSPRDWLHLEGRALDNSNASPSDSVRPDNALTLRHQATIGRTATVAENPTNLDSPRKLSEPEATDTSQRVIQRAQELIGTPYKWGGMSEANGFDCSGLLVYLFRSEAGMELPRTTSLMIHEDFQRVPRDELQPGDAVFFTHNGQGGVGHVGLYVGNNLFIHAPRTGKSIRIDSLDNRYWSDRYSSARRFNEESST